ncbi:MAG: GIY-YIG nuclease family protein [Mesorhizobium sp.]|nr:MAG: GIY-YIG nuclease family protein [Mesorhizobium sp.]
MQLSASELAFLKSIGFGAGDVLDARTMSKTTAIATAKAQGKALYVAGECTKARHRLKFRSGGHCAQCVPMRQTFQKRQDISGGVYVCASNSLGLVKVGSSTEFKTRAKKLNFEGYAGAKDWRLVYWATVSNSGRVESSAHSQLNPYVRRLSYSRDGHHQTAYECFACTITVAIAALRKEMQAGEPVEFWKGVV